MTEYISPYEVGQNPVDGQWYMLRAYPELLTARIDAAGGEASWIGKRIAAAVIDGVIRDYPELAELVREYFVAKAYRQGVLFGQDSTAPSLDVSEPA